MHTRCATNLVCYSHHIFYSVGKEEELTSNFDVGVCVLAKNFSTGRCWLEGTILGASGPKSYQIELTDGCVIRWHVNHVHLRTSNSQIITGNP